uniref:Ufm1-specific protease 2 n=1 Tax=Arion vulgaris TaxID=1028688 RepID=A0A0B6ZGC2_9EUPU
MAATDIVSISHKLLKSISSSKWSGQGVKGFLVGDLDVGSLYPHVVRGAWQRELTDTSELKEEIDECLGHFPGGRNIVGAVLLLSPQAIKSFEEDDEAGIEREFEEAFGSYTPWLEQLGLTQVIVLCLWCHLESDEHWKYSSFMLNEDGVSRALISHDLPTKHVVKFRLRADIPLLISTESDTEEQLKCALDHELMKLQNHAQSGDFLFGLDENKVIIQGKQAIFKSGVHGWTSCKDISKYFLEREGGTIVGGGSGKKRTGVLYQAPVPVSLLQLSTVESSGSLQYAPIIRHNIGSFKTSSLTLPVDVLVEVDGDLPVLELSHILNESVARQIVSMFHCLSAGTQKTQLHTPEVFHCKSSNLDTSVTVVYPKGVSETELEKERQILHQHLCLPLTHPFLRRGAAGFFLRQTSPGGYLINTHIGIPDPPVKSATISQVIGYYSYHHYMQDHFDDDKWGCAYRSLQTIVSWFKYQGYTDKEIPSHRDIQQALFEVGDKNQAFVGSRQWIGSFEVSFVLDHLLGVTSKFINVNSGSELSSVGQELSNHFQTQGTPVMIGGGVLAHTILGVAYSDVTGDISFLILDPHYTGGEDLRVIQDKGWCGWKDVSFWNQTAHYNMCLPQRPIVI